MSLAFEAPVDDEEWGCTYREVAIAAGTGNIKLCFVEVADRGNFAKQLSGLILDTSWMASLDKGVRRQYDYTVRETASILLKIFEEAAGEGEIASEFGELMVSLGSARGLEAVFEHIKVPLAELWKPQAKQNEGFDFHTVCLDEYVNFGEAKFSSSANPHGLALSQAHGFLEEEKHLRDRAHLVNFVSSKSIDQLDDDDFGVIAAFSVNSANPLVIFKNAVETAADFVAKKKIKAVYLVGVGAKC